MPHTHPRRTPIRHTLPLLGAIVALVLSAPALAQLGGLLGGDRDKVPEFGVRIGWPAQGALAESLAPAERFIPIRITVAATDEAVDGLITVEFDQDGSQRSRLVAPFATTPGRDTTVDLIATLPRNLAEIDVTLRTADGQRQRLFVPGASGEDEQELPSIGIGAPVIALVGPRAESARALQSFPLSDETTDSDSFEYESDWRHFNDQLDIAQFEPAWQSVSVAVVRPDDLPSAWAAYESLTTLVIDVQAIADIEPRTRDAIITWVTGGGRLIILAPPGLDEVSPITPAVARVCFRTLDPVRAPVDPTLRDRIQPSDDEAAETESTPITQGVFALTDEGRRHGWRLRWTPDALDTDPLDGVGAIAEGPAGFGWITLVGVDPVRVAATLDRTATNAAWREIITPLVQSRLREGGGWSYTSSSGANPAERIAVEHAINLTGRADVDPAPIFIGVVVCIGLLALLLGPIDFLVLKRLRKRHFSWLTASAYILCFTLIAAALPVLLRGGATEANRAEVVDIVRLAPADPADLAAERVDLAWRAGLTGLTSQRAEPIQLDTDALGQRAAWRGLSSLSTFYNQNTNRLAPVSYAARGLTRPIGAIPSPLWTFRALADHGPAEPDAGDPLPDIDVIAQDDGAYRLEIRNLRPGDRLADASVLLGDAYHTPSDETASRTVSDTGRVDVVLEPSQVSANARRARALLNNPPIASRDHHDHGSRSPMRAYQPGVLERNQAIAARLDTGRWALAVFDVSRDASNVAARQGDQDAHTQLHRTYRAVVPLRPRDATPTASAIEQEPANQRPGQQPEDTDA